MKPRQMAEFWLRDRARDLIATAEKATKAYTKQPMLGYCIHVASAYRRAAVVLYEAADQLRDEA